MGKKRTRFFACDFETTVYEGQEFTEVWASASVEMWTEDTSIFNSIDDQFNYFLSLNENLILYYHNLKFDGNFWLPFLIKQGFKQAINLNDDKKEGEWLSKKSMPNKSFKYIITDVGQWYSIVIKYNKKYIEIRDSLKLLPFSLEEIGKAFNTKHKKLTMEYKGFRYAGCHISDDEKEYIFNDVLVLKEALEIIFSQGHDKLTIGSCCLSEYKTLTGDDFDKMFPPLTEYILDENIFEAKNTDHYIRKSYKGGFCLVVSGKENRIFRNGITLDVNSLYPSQMHSESGNKYPIGSPTFWTGNFIPDEAKKDDKYYFVRIKTRFTLKKDMLPFIQIKGNPLYDGNENLETSDVFISKTGKYHRFFTDTAGNKRDTRVTLTLTETDYKLFQEHYKLEDFEILDGCFFTAKIGIFDKYIDKYKSIKIRSKGAIRTIAKLFLNNLYGKLATNEDNYFKVAELKEGVIKFTNYKGEPKNTVFVACGSAITSYARNFTIRTAQLNYYGVNKKGFIYADTDSLHCDLPLEKIKGITIHNSDFNKWSYECAWDKAIFVRAKTYIEHIIIKDGQQVEKPYYDIKCAGMPERSKELFNYVLEKNQYNEEEKNTFIKKCNLEEINFLDNNYKLNGFKVGLVIPGKLKPKLIRGGVILVDTPFTIRKKRKKTVNG